MAWCTSRPLSARRPPVYYGWIVGYNASTLAQVSVLTIHCCASDGKNRWNLEWLAERRRPIPANNLYVITGNGAFNGLRSRDSF